MYVLRPTTGFSRFARHSPRSRHCFQFDIFNWAEVFYVPGYILFILIILEQMSFGCQNVNEDRRQLIGKKIERSNTDLFRSELLKQFLGVHTINFARTNISLESLPADNLKLINYPLKLIISYSRGKKYI